MREEKKTTLMCLFSFLNFINFIYIYIYIFTFIFQNLFDFLIQYVEQKCESVTTEDTSALHLIDQLSKHIVELSFIMAEHASDLFLSKLSEMNEALTESLLSRAQKGNVLFLKKYIYI